MARGIIVLFVRGADVYDVSLTVENEWSLSAVKALALDALIKLFPPGSLFGADLDFSLINEEDATAIAEKRALNATEHPFVATRTVGASFVEDKHSVFVKERAGEMPAAPWDAPRRSARPRRLTPSPRSSPPALPRRRRGGRGGGGGW